MKNIGVTQTINNLSYEYKLLADNDEEAGIVLANNRMYRHAIYFILQAMEKNIRAKIFERVNPNLEYYRERNRNHSLDSSIEFLVDIISPDDNIRAQIKNMFINEVFNGLNSANLHNNLRYPFYNKFKNSYLSIEYNENDFNYILLMLKNLKVFLNDIYKI